MTRAQHVQLNPPARGERFLLPLLLVAAWWLSVVVAGMLWRGVWPEACDGIGLFDAVRAWYDHLAAAMMAGVAGLGLGGFGLGLWWVLRPLRRGERWLLALALPAVVFASATPWLLQETARRGQARAMATLVEVMRPAVTAMERGRLTDAVCAEAARQVVTALPHIAHGQPRPTVTVAMGRPEARPGRPESTPTLMVSYQSNWLAWDPRSRRWLGRLEWDRRAQSPP